MAKIIAFTNQKGGVGKTTTCVNMAAYLALMGKRVLVVDIDPQGSSSSGFGIEKRKLEYSIYTVLVGESDEQAEDGGKTPLERAIKKTAVEGLDIIPASIDLAGAEVELVYFENREFILKKALNALRNNYDYICIDCPPSLGLLTINAITASDSVLVPIQCEFYALEGLGQLMNTVKLVKQKLNKNLEIEGVALTMYDGRSNIVASITDEIHKYFGRKVFSTKIPRNIRIVEAPSYGMPIAQYDPRCAGAQAYKLLTEEFLERNHDTYTKIVNDLSLRRKPRQ